MNPPILIYCLIYCLLAFPTSCLCRQDIYTRALPAHAEINCSPKDVHSPLQLPASCSHLLDLVCGIHTRMRSHAYLRWSIALSSCEHLNRTSFNFASAHSALSISPAKSCRSRIASAATPERADPRCHTHTPAFSMISIPPDVLLSEISAGNPSPLTFESEGSVQEINSLRHLTQHD